MQAREIAKNLIRHYVLRGDSFGYLRSSYLGAGCKDYNVSIGGYDTDNNKKIPNTKIAVRKIKGKEVNILFNLQEIFDEILYEQSQSKLNI